MNENKLMRTLRSLGIDDVKKAKKMVADFTNDWLYSRVQREVKGDLNEKILAYRSHPLRCRNQLCQSTGSVFIHGVLYEGKESRWIDNVKHSLVHEHDASGKRWIPEKVTPYGLDEFLKPSITQEEPNLTQEQILHLFE